MQATPSTVSAEHSEQAFFTPREVAARIKFHKESVRRAIREGRIRAVSFGRFKRVPAAEVTRIEASGW
jgi:excisionase family DNA binding protein